MVMVGEREREAFFRFFLWSITNSCEKFGDEPRRTTTPSRKKFACTTNLSVGHSSEQRNLYSHILASRVTSLSPVTEFMDIRAVILCSLQKSQRR